MEPFVLGELNIRYDLRRVAVARRTVRLTPTEYELLRELSMNEGRVLTRESRLRQAWGGRHKGSVDPKLVRAVVKRLRRPAPAGILPANSIHPYTELNIKQTQ